MISSGNESERPLADEKLEALAVRAGKAGLQSRFKWWRSENAKPWLAIDFPSPSGVHSFDIRAEEAGPWLWSTFDEVDLLGDLRAVRDRASGVIYALLDRPISASSLRLEQIPGIELGPIEDPSDSAPSPPDDTLAFPAFEPPGRSSKRPFTLTIKSSRSDLMVEITNRPLKQVEWLRTSSTSFRSLNMTVRGFDGTPSPQWLSDFEAFAGSLFFDMSLAYDIDLKIPRATDWNDRVDLSAKPLASAAPRIPARRYHQDVTALYFYARSSRLPPLLRYLAFYQCLEFYFPAYSRQQAVSQLRRSLLDPRFDAHDDHQLGQVLDQLLSGRGANPPERDQLRFTLEACLDARELEAFVAADSRAAFLADKKSLTGVRHINLKDRQTPLVKQVSDRIYDLRCRIVHSMEQSPEADVRYLLPFSSETRMLGHDLELVQHAAQQVIINSGIASDRR